MEENNYLISKDHCSVSYRNTTENRPQYDEGKSWCRGSKVYTHYGMFHFDEFLARMWVQGNKRP